MKYLKFLTVILVVAIIGILIYSLSLRKDLINCKNLNQENPVNNNEKNDNEETKEYDCSFTRTYNIVNTLDGYISEVKELSYVVIDQFQTHSAYTHIIPTQLKEKLKNNNTYEFTYTLKGNGIINDMDDIYSAIAHTTVYNADQNSIYNEPKLKVNLTIKKTDKTGLEQYQEPICQSK